LTPDPRDAEIEDLRRRLDEAEETLRAIRAGEVDALVVTDGRGSQIYTLQSADQPYRILIEEMQEGAVTLSETGVILYCNLRFAEMLGIRHEKLISSEARRFVSPQDAERFESLISTGRKRSNRAEIMLRTPDGRDLPAFIAISPLPQEVEGCLCMVVTDLTEQQSMLQKQAEIEQLNAMLRRSMIETHHRVKNNLQIIAAMVDLQVMQDSETLPVGEIRRLGTHVRTLAVVHDLLTAEAKEGGHATTVSGKTVLEQLLPLLSNTAGGREISMTIQDARLTSRQATSLALVTSELVSNALKHGRGRVEVSFLAGELSAMLEVCDDGPGFPAGFQPLALGTTGLSLVENLSRWDMGGAALFENRPGGGARVRVSIPLPAAA
jgi:two-component system, sensor histidine kinase PdtaS